MINHFLAFDTRIDTTKFFVPMNFNFVKRNYVNKRGLSPIYLHITSQYQRERINLDIYVPPKYWDKKEQKLNGPDEHVGDLNLILDNVKSKITNIKTTFRLSSKMLTLENFIEEFNNEMPRTNFVTYFKKMLEDRKNTIHPATYKKERAIFRKLKSYNEEIIFCNIDNAFIVEYRNHLANIGNQKVTRNNNIKIIKKYLRYAVKNGIKLKVDLDDIKVGSTKGNRTYLNPREVKICFDYFNSTYICKLYKLVVGYFLFSCFTGLRLSDILDSQREHLKYGNYTFVHNKTGKQQVIRLNKKAKYLIDECEDLFVKKYTPKYIGEILAEIFKQFDINKKVSFHVGRHTFATNFILMGGSVVKLQQLLNHSKITDTMIYVHMAEQEKDTEIDLLDGLFKGLSN